MVRNARNGLGLFILMAFLYKLTIFDQPKRHEGGSGAIPQRPIWGDFEIFTTSWAMDHVPADINTDINQRLVKKVRILFGTHFF
jgi:hypothetical protein